MISVLNTLKEGTVPKIKKPFTKEGCQENVNSLLAGIKALGVPDDKLFKPNDLLLGENIPTVVTTLIELGKAVCIPSRVFTNFSLIIVN